MASVIPNIDSVIAHLKEVKAEVHLAALAVKGRAEANLGRHHKTGTHSIQMDKQDTDRVVNLVGPNAISVEYGHIAYRGKKRLRAEPVPGTRIIRDAAGL